MDGTPSTPDAPMRHDPPRSAFARLGLGRLLAFQRDPLGTLERNHEDKSRAPEWMAGQGFVYLHAPADVEWMMRQRSDVLVKDHFMQTLRKIVGNGILVSEGDTWRRHRGLMAHAFTPKRIGSYVPVMARATARVVEPMREGEVVDVHDVMNRITMDIVAKALFDADVTDEGATVGHALEHIMAYFANSAEVLLDVPDWFPTPVMRRFVRARASVQSIVDRIIHTRAASGEGDRGDLLSALLAARDEAGEPMARGQLRDEVVTLFLAGHETTSLLLAHVLVELAGRPDVVARIRDEAAAVLGDRAPSADDAKQLVYVERVLLEALRLYPSAWAIGREAVQEVTLAGHTYPKGTQLLASPWAMHRDGTIFADPLRFDPDRWTPEFRKSLPRGAYFPFSDGPRVCIGNHFAMLEAQVVLVEVLRRVTLSLEPGQKLEFAPSVTLRAKRGIRMRVHRHTA